jgi:hypothetical protein
MVFVRPCGRISVVPSLALVAPVAIGRAVAVRSIYASASIRIIINFDKDLYENGIRRCGSHGTQTRCAVSARARVRDPLLLPLAHHSVVLSIADD